MNGWNQYRTQFQDFTLTLAEAELIAKAAGTALADFPRRLPEDARQGFVTAMYDVGEALTEVAGSLEDSTTNKISEASVELDDPDSLFLPFLTITAIRAIQGQPIEQLKFQAALFAQQLITIIAHTEAFLGDTLRAICFARPEIVQTSQKQITYEVALSFPDRDFLFAALVDEYVTSRLRTNSMKGLVAALSKEHGLLFELDPQMIATMTLGEQVRHLLVHNGGRVDHQFIRRTGASSVQPDERYPLDEKLVREVKGACENATQEVFAVVAKKYFGIEDLHREVGIMKNTRG
jgi:hypothetical protein